MGQGPEFVKGLRPYGQPGTEFRVVTAAATSGV
jgi:hypothetical protein